MTSSPLRRFRAFALLGTLLVGGFVRADGADKILKFRGLTVRLGAPIEVTRQIGYGLEFQRAESQPSWGLIHLTPFMAGFPEGQLIVTYAMDPDTQINPFFMTGYQISDAEGRTWGRRYSTIMQHNPLLFIPRKDNTLLGVACELMEGNGPGTFVGPAYIFSRGGKKLIMVPDAVRVVGWSEPIAHPYKSPQPPDNWHAGPTLTGSAVILPDRILATGQTGVESGQPDPWRKGRKEVLRHNGVFSSEDGGFTWRWYATVGAYEPQFRGERYYEGPNESYMIQLADGELMDVYRVGQGERWKLHRSYSHDGGRIWTRPDLLPAWSVRPALLRLKNGVIALTTGRPGIYLWLADDPRATHWQSVDLIAWHNEWAPDPSQKIGRFERDGRMNYETTSYTGMVEISRNHLLMVYDRDPERPPTSPADLSRVYVMPIEIGRTGL